jgi:diguanylate cyclase (GGDEF)-like protein
VLVEVVRRLLDCVRGCDTLTRHGGDEFVILLEELVNLEQATWIGQRVLRAFNQPLHTLAGNIPVSASIGIHVATDDDDYEPVLAWPIEPLD